MFLDFAYFSICLETKETTSKRGESIFSEPEMLRSSLGQFRKALIKIKQLKLLMALSLTSKKLRAVKFLGNFSDCLVI